MFAMTRGGLRSLGKTLLPFAHKRELLSRWSSYSLKASSASWASVVAYAGQETRQCLSHYMSVSHSSPAYDDYWATIAAPSLVSVTHQGWHRYCHLGAKFWNVMWDSVWTAVSFTHNETTSWNTYPQTQRGALTFAGSNSEARFCRNILEAVLAKRGGGCGWGRAVAHEVYVLLWDFQTMKIKLIFLKNKHHRLGNTGPLVRDPQPGPYNYLISSFLTPSPSCKASGSDCRVWKMWVQVPALPLAGCLTWGNSEPSLNLGFFIYEVRNNNRSCVAKVINIILKMGKQQRTAVRMGSGVWIPLLPLTGWPWNKLLNLSVCLICKGG